MNRKTIIYIGVGLISISMIALFILQPMAGRRTGELPSVKPMEPPFIKEGELVFWDQETRDTLVAIDIEIADDDASIERGLMFRRSMGDNQGMLFKFPQMEERAFWMKNTYISLDIIFVDNEYRIVNVQEGTKPLSTQSVPSTGPAQFVIEVNAGFCNKYGIQAGDIVSFMDS